MSSLFMSGAGAGSMVKVPMPKPAVKVIIPGQDPGDKPMAVNSK